MIQAGNELLRHASSISPNPRRVRSRSCGGGRLRTARPRLIFILSLAASITVVASGPGCPSEKPAEPTVSVQVVPVKKATIEQTVTSEAVLYPLAQSAIRSEERRVGKECRSLCDWSSDVCSSDLAEPTVSVQVVPVKKATIEQTVTSEAVLYPLAQSAIVPKIRAPIKAFYVNSGGKPRAR